MCDTLCVLAPESVDCRSWFAKNSDRPLGEAQRLEWHPPRLDEGDLDTTHRVVEATAAETLGVLGSRPDWGWGFEHGVNAAGVAIGNERIFTQVDPQREPASLTGMDLVRLGLERAETASGAVSVITELLDRYGQGGPCQDGGREPYWSSFLVVDPSSGYVIETSGSLWAVDSIGGGRAISNRLDIETFDRDHGIESPILDACVNGRRATTREAVIRGAGLAGLRSTLRSHDRVDDGWQDGWTVCMHVEGDQATAASMIVDLSADPPVARVSQGSPCRSVFVPLAVGSSIGDPPVWERFAGLRPAAEGVLADLEPALDADFDPGDPNWPHEAWGRVESVLTSLEQELRPV